MIGFLRGSAEFSLKTTMLSCATWPADLMPISLRRVVNSVFKAHGSRVISSGQDDICKTFSSELGMIKTDLPAARRPFSVLFPRQLRGAILLVFRNVFLRTTSKHDSDNFNDAI